MMQHSSISSPFIPRHAGYHLALTPHRIQVIMAEELTRFSVLVCHRRFGKTVFAVMRLWASAINASARGITDARYAYIAPFRKQAKSIAWAYFRRLAWQHPGVSLNESELIVSFANGAQITLYGADNPDALRGAYLDGAVLDEVADMRPQVWGEIVRPMLADRLGWALFIGTPRGVNQFYDLYDKAVTGKAGKNWSGHLLDVNHTLDFLPHLSWEEIEDSKLTMSDAQVRQEWYCDFNAAQDSVLIPIDLANGAMGKYINAVDYLDSPKVIGVDVARFGDDRSCIFQRQGLASFDPKVFRKKDNMHIAAQVAAMADSWKPDAIFVDGGRGEGVIDRLRQLGFSVTEVNFGGSADDGQHYADKRSEMWDRMADWLNAGGCLPDEPAVRRDLVTPTYGFDTRSRMRLESKDHIKNDRGLDSPDVGDALALTFAYPVYKQRVIKRKQEYHPFDFR